MMCEKMPDGTFTISGLSYEQTREIEDGIIEQFNRTSKKIHSSYRKQLLSIYRPISLALDLHDRQQEIELITPKIQL